MSDNWLQPFSPTISGYEPPLTCVMAIKQLCVLQNTYISRASNFRDLSRIVKSNTRKFLEFAHNHNFINIEYQRLENTPN